MNTYVKYCPNVFVAKCDTTHEKGETIDVTTKYGKENECIVFNLVAERNNSYYYSIVRADGFDKREWLHKRAERARQSAIYVFSSSSVASSSSSELSQICCAILLNSLRLKPKDATFLLVFNFFKTFVNFILFHFC